MINKRKHPHFHRQNVPRRHMRGLQDKWRKPRGIDNKQRMHLDYAGALVDIGWRTARATRHLHPSGVREALVHNHKELQAINAPTAVRLSATIGAKKRAHMLKAAAQKGLRVLNA